MRPARQPVAYVVHGFLLAACVARLAASEPDAAGVAYFEKHVRPVLVEHCYACHGGKDTKGGLRLDSRGGWVEGGDSGPVLVVGKPDESLLIQAVRYGGDIEMPPDGRLPDAVIGALERWVEMGAPDPRVGDTVRKVAALDLAAGREHWAYRPVVAVSVPAVRDESWPSTAPDRFILARLEAEGLVPAPDAPRSVLARRLYFDLIGLPPTPEQVDEFAEDTAPGAYERLVDRLMSSPQFGERWGRRWLDITRFAESLTLRGFVLKEAWRYRDYVVDAWNADQPADQFLREQIAGDLLPADAPADRRRNLIATTYLTLGNTNLEEQDKRQLEMDFIDEQLDVISKGLLAQTVTCARCHDHKFDPIPTRDYYALAGIFKSVQSLEHANVSKWMEVPLPLDPELEAVHRRHEAEIAALQEKVAAARAASDLAAANSPASAASIVAPHELPGIVIDDVAATRVGQWQESQYTKRYIGRGYAHDQNQGQGEKTLTFSPELPRDGVYEVRFAYTPGTNRDQRVPVTVFSADGEKTFYINERLPPPIDGHFVSLGRFRFERAGQSFVIVSNEGVSGHVIADAVQFLPFESPAVTAQRSSPGGANQITAPSAAAAELQRLESQLKQRNAKAPYRPAAMSVVELPQAADIPISIRGNIHNPGSTVPRGFLQVCSTTDALRPPADESGRRELAEWLVHSDNPLTARVLVNRLWHWLLGAGLVRTVDNFGTTGEAPSHPELLDYLAQRFVGGGWSLKAMVREVVLSRTYRQSSTAMGQPAAARAGQPATESLASSAGESTVPPPVGSSGLGSSDPENRWLSRANRRRLDAECLRDAMLLTSGEMRWEMGGPTFARELASDYGYQHVDRRRSIYSPVFRNALPEIFDAFDFADPSVVSGRRSVSTVAPQALFMMNHPFVLEQSRRAAERLLAEPVRDEAQRVTMAFRRVLGRIPAPGEIQASLEFLNAAGGGEQERSRGDVWAEFMQSLFASLDFRYVE